MTRHLCFERATPRYLAGLLVLVGLAVGGQAAATPAYLDGALVWNQAICTGTGNSVIGAVSRAGYVVDPAAALPQLGQVTYIHAVVTNINPCGGDVVGFDFFLPPGASFAVSAVNPVQCYIGNGSTSGPAPNCSQQAFPGNYGGSFFGYQSGLAPGWSFEIQVPVIFTQPLAGSTLHVATTSVWGRTDSYVGLTVPFGMKPSTEGDPHIKTVDGVRYDFQSAGEFILLRGGGLELQARQTAVTAASPVGPDPHTGLTSCVSINTAVALKVGPHRITYQPEIVDETGKEGGKRRRLQLRIDGKLVELEVDGIGLSSGGRIVRTTVPDGIEIHAPGGEGVVITPGWWDYYQVWYMNIEVQHTRSTEGVMGAVAPGNWLPALSNGDLLGPRPVDLSQVHRDLHETFAKSWRVDTKTSLFDYEPGLSPRAFVIEDWPVSGSQSCVAPPQPGGPVARPAPAARPASGVRIRS